MTNKQLYFPVQELNLDIQLPSSKSISNRALIINALAYGHYDIQNLSDCDDTEVTVKALNSNDTTFDIGAAGTAMVDKTGKFFKLEDLDANFVAEKVDQQKYAEFAGRFVKNAYDPTLTDQDETLDVSICMPNGGGYAPFLYGKVVDMFYFPIIKNPAEPDKAYFFPWIFNVADSAITVSVAIILLFFRKELNSSLEKKPANDDHIKE